MARRSAISESLVAVGGQPTGPYVYTSPHLGVNVRFCRVECYGQECVFRWRRDHWCAARQPSLVEAAKRLMVRFRDWHAVAARVSYRHARRRRSRAGRRFPCTLSWLYKVQGERAPSRRLRPSRWSDDECWRVVKTKLLAYSVGAASSRRRAADVPVVAAWRRSRSMPAMWGTSTATVPAVRVAALAASVTRA